MAYVYPNLKSKAAIKRAIADGKHVTVRANSPFENVPVNGTCSVEGPHAPEPHKWYGTVTIVNGVVTKIS